jgi:hypothetical protein
MVATYVEHLMAETIRLVTDALDVAMYGKADQEFIESITERLGQLKIEMWEHAKIPSEARHAFHEAATMVEKFLSLVSVQCDNGDDDEDKEMDNG